MGEELTAADVARMFGVGVTTVNKWAREGMLPKPVEGSRPAKWRRADIETVRGKQQSPPGVL